MYSKAHETMLEVFQGVADSINGLINYDGDSDNGHRNILLGGDVETGFSLQYNTTDNVWVMNSNGSYHQYDGVNIATVPAQTSTPSTGQDNNKEIDQKIQTVKDNLQSLKNSQDQTYQTQKLSLNNAVQQLADQFASQEAQAEKDNNTKVQAFNAQQESALASFIAALTKQVEALNPGPKPSTPSSGASSSGASSATSSSSSSAASSSASSAGSSAASSAASSSASSAANPKTSSAAVIPVVAAQSSSSQPMSRVAQKNGKHAYPATGESQAGAILAEAGAVVIAVLGLAGVRKYRHAK